MMSGAIKSSARCRALKALCVDLMKRNGWCLSQSLLSGCERGPGPRPHITAPRLLISDAGFYDRAVTTTPGPSIPQQL